MFNIFKSKKQPTVWPDIEEVKERISEFELKAWHPTTDSRESEHTASKFSGVPALQENETWPSCGNCSEPMQLLLQLNSKELPVPEDEGFGDGVLQVFCCTNNKNDCLLEFETNPLDPTSALVRVLDTDTISNTHAAEVPSTDSFPERSILSWNAVADYPSFVDLDINQKELPDEYGDTLANSDYPLAKDKFLGWANWIDHHENPACPQCNERMRVLFQIDPEDNIPHTFGKASFAYVMQCELHRNKLALSWAWG